MVIRVRRRPHAERSGRFRLSPGPVPQEGRATCGVFGAFFCSAPVCRTRRATRGFSCAVFCIAPTYRAGCPACRQFKLLGSSARSVARSGPSSGAQVAYEVSEPLQAPFVPVAGRISDVSESSQADPQDVLGHEQPIHDLLLRELLAKQQLGTCLDR